MQRDRLADLPADRVQRVERGHRLLEDHRDVIAADALHLALAELEQVPALEADRTADDTARRVGNQAQDGECRHALAAARFSHDAQRLAALQLVGYAVDCAHRADRREEVRLQILDLQNRRRRHHSRLTDGARPRIARIQASDSQSFVVLLLAFGEEGLPSEHTALDKEKAKWEEARCKTMSPSVPA
jgi:hypothetical protein